MERIFLRPYLSDYFVQVFKEFLSFRMVCIEQMSHVEVFSVENGLKGLKKMRKLIMGKNYLILTFL